LNPIASETVQGAAEREFSQEFLQADTLDNSNSTVFNFEAYVRWRIIQKTCSDDVPLSDRVRIQRCFFERLGDRLLDGPLRAAYASSIAESAANTTVRQLNASLVAVLDAMQENGMFAKYSLQAGQADLVEEDDLISDSSISWQCMVSASVVAGGSQLAQDRYAAIGKGVGFYSGQLIIAPLAACVRRAGGAVTAVEEYFMDNRIGLPEPSTWADKRYYSDTLIELETGRR
jgi:hypothetical protein